MLTLYVLNKIDHQLDQQPTVVTVYLYLSEVVNASDSVK